MRTSVELVPRSRLGLLAEARMLRECFPVIDTINVPDLQRFSLRSWEAAKLLRPLLANRIPHVPARNHEAGNVDRLVVLLREAQVREVIVIAGDPQPGASPASPPQPLIGALAKRMPGIAIYAALDPYAYDDDARLARNITAKLDAGATGFFSQPLFSLDEFWRCAALLPDVPVFWGLSPVTSAQSRRYWERINAVRFAPGFEPTLSWNHHFGIALLKAAAARGDNAYLMPIRVDVAAYVAPLYPCIRQHADCTVEAIPAMRGRSLSSGR
jgi:methylenetetrahydrofolate reductase (NADPH)